MKHTAKGMILLQLFHLFQFCDRWTSWMTTPLVLLQTRAFLYRKKELHNLRPPLTPCRPPHLPWSILRGKKWIHNLQPPPLKSSYNFIVKLLESSWEGKPFSFFSITFFWHIMGCVCMTCRTSRFGNIWLDEIFVLAKAMLLKFGVCGTLGV